MAVLTAGARAAVALVLELLPAIAGATTAVVADLQSAAGNSAGLEDHRERVVADHQDVTIGDPRSGGAIQPGAWRGVLGHPDIAVVGHVQVDRVGSGNPLGRSRPEARRVGIESVRTFRSRWSPYHYNKTKAPQHCNPT